MIWNSDQNASADPAFIFMIFRCPPPSTSTRSWLPHSAFVRNPYKALLSSFSCKARSTSSSSCALSDWVTPDTPPDVHPPLNHNIPPCGTPLQLKSSNPPFVSANSSSFRFFTRNFHAKIAFYHLTC